MTVLLDNWKIALSIAVVGRTFEPADLVIFSVKFTIGSAGPEGQGSIVGGFRVSVPSQVHTAPTGACVKVHLGTTLCLLPSAHGFSHASAFAQQLL